MLIIGLLQNASFDHYSCLFLEGESSLADSEPSFQEECILSTYPRFGFKQRFC